MRKFVQLVGFVGLIWISFLFLCACFGIMVGIAEKMNTSEYGYFGHVIHQGMHSPNNVVMMNILPLLILLFLIFMVPLLLVILGRKLFRSKDNTPCSADDIRLIKELQQGFMRMQERIESLEAILIDRKYKA